MKKNIYKFNSGVNQKFLALSLLLLSGLAQSQTTYTFNYTGSVQTITLQPGNYSVQCWGADGGNATNGTNPMLGGRGGFATGIYSNTALGVFNVYVGGQGGNATGSAVGGGGGGMSDIAPATNPTLIVIAAGGGGGGTSSGTTSELSTGGDGGGLIGGTAIDGSGVSGGSAATGGSQSAGGFATPGSYGAGSPGGYGYGGGAANGGTAGVIHSAGGGGGNGGNGGWNGGGGGSTLTGINDNAGGGGAGYYGGGGGRGDGGAGGGGSSFIGGVTSGATFSFGQTGFVTKPIVSGNGLVLITELCNFDLYAANNSNSLSPIICAGQSATLMTNAISNYSWSTGATSSSLVVSPTTNTFYTLSATSPSNCSTARTISVTVSSGIPVLSISNPSNNICLGQTATLTASGALTYTWSNPGVVNGQSFAPVSTAVYTVNGSNGCGTSSAQTTIAVAPLAVTASSSPTIICEGSTATLAANSAVSGYTWEPGTISSSVAIVSPASTTVYTVTASDGICSGTQTVLITTKTTPTIIASATSTNICPGDQVVLTATGGTSYVWNPGNLSGSSVTVSPGTSTAYVVVGTNSVNCTSSANQIVIVGTSPTVVVSPNKPISCPGDEVILTASGADSYAWNGGPASASYTIFPSSTMVYTVVGSLTNSPCTDTRTYTVNVAVVNVSATSNTAICAGGTVQLEASGASSYAWNGIPGGTITLNPVATTVYTLVAQTNSGSAICTSSLTVQVIVNPNPTITVAATRSIVCKGESNTLTATGAASYVWQGTLGTSSTVVVKPNSTTIYTLTGTSTDGCSAGGLVTAIVTPCSGIDDYAAGSKISVYPNPNNGEFFISHDSEIRLNVVNTLGQPIRAVELNNENGFRAEVSGLAKGIYYLRFEKDLTRSAIKLVVN